MSQLGMEVVLTATDRGLQAQLKDAKGQIIDLAQTLKQNLPAASNQAAQGMNGLMGKFKEFRQEQVQQGRQARFVANEIMSIIPAGDGAKGALEGMAGILIEGAAGGLSFGLALEGAKLAVGFLAAGWKEAEEAAAKFQAGLVKMRNEVDALRIGVWKGHLEMKGFTPAMMLMAESVAPAEMAMGDLTDAVNRQRAALAALKEDEIATLGTGNTSQTEGQIAAAEARLADLERQLAEQGKILAGRKAMAANLVNKDEEPAAAKAAADLREERAKKLAEQLKQQAAAILGMNQSFADLEASAFGPLKDPRTMRSDSKGAGVQRYFGAEDTANSYSQVEIDMAGTKDQHQAAEAMEKLRAEAAAKRREMMQKDGQMYVQLATQLGDVFGRIATGQTSIIAGIKEMISGMVKVVAQAMIELELAIAVAAAKAAGSVSIVPFIGPALGIAAAAAMFGALMAYMPSAATGWDRLPSDQVVLAHKGERIIPSYDADRLDALAEGGGGGGTFNIYAHDARSFDQYLRDNRVTVVRVLQAAAKDGVY